MVHLCSIQPYLITLPYKLPYFTFFVGRWYFFPPSCDRYRRENLLLFSASVFFLLVSDYLRIIFAALSLLVNMFRCINCLLTISSFFSCVGGRDGETACCFSTS